MCAPIAAISPGELSSSTYSAIATNSSGVLSCALSMSASAASSTVIICLFMTRALWFWWTRRPVNERTARAAVDVVDDPTGQADQLFVQFKLDVAHGAVEGTAEVGF